MSLRNRVARASRLRGYARLAGAGARANGLPCVAYVGWTGEGNLGDEAMFAAHRANLGFAANVIPVPIFGDNYALRRLAHRIDAVCLGGGTLIGNGYFRQGLESAMSAAPNAPRFMVGSGAESLDYAEGNRSETHRELQKWRPLLGEFEHVRVRGPLSVETLAAIDVSATAVGDPALALPNFRNQQAITSASIVGINVGQTDDQWGGSAIDPGQLLVQLVASVQALGLQARIIPTTVQDNQFMRDVVASAGLNCQLPVAMPSLPALLTWLAECDSVVAMKLHASVLAAGQGVPVYAIEYRPKCRDFMASIDSEHTCVRIDQLDHEHLKRWLSDPPDDKSAAQNTATQALRNQILGAFTDEAVALARLSSARLKER